MIKTNITIAELMRLNPWIKTEAQARKILHDVKTKPHASLNDAVVKARNDSRA